MNKDTNMDMKIVNIAKAGSAAFIDDEKSWLKTRRIKGLLVSFLSDGSQDSRLVEATACHLKEKRKKNAPRKAVHAYEIDDATESKPKPKSLFDSIPLLKGHTASLQREFSRGLFMVAS